MRAKKCLSMLLVLVMMLSLFPMNAFALGGGSEIGIGGGFGRDIGDDEVRDFDPSNLIEDAEEPVDLFQGLDTERGIQVTVESRNNALPTMAEVRVTPVEAESVREAVEAAVEGQPNILVAMDISFWLDGIEIEPEEPVNVKISAPELTGRTDLQVVHIPDAEDAQAETVELVDESELSFALGTNEVAFKADSFSVYAVIGDGSSARATVNFYRGEEIVGTMYVKEGDTREDLDTIVYDPGAGNTEGLIFKGWTKDPNFDDTTEPMTIAQVRDEISEKTITDGDVYNYYALLYKVYKIDFVEVKEDGTEIALGAASATVHADQTSGDVTIEMNYQPSTSKRSFLGWTILEGKANITKAVDSDGNELALDTLGTETNPIENGTVLTVSGPVKLKAYAPEGAWLTFSENGKHATYNAPQFVKSGQVTVRPFLAQDNQMKRPGYVFGGWYTDQACTTGNEFTFGQALEEDTIIYAKWTAVTTANYSVVIWKQNVTGEGYDYDYTLKLSGTVGQIIDTVTQQGDGNSAYARIKDTNYVGKVPIEGKVHDYTGFHLKEFDQEVTIRPEGDSILNVYYDRTEYTLTFTVPMQGYHAVDPSDNTGNQYRPAPETWSGYADIYYNSADGKWYQDRNWVGNYWNGYYEYSNEYTGTRYKNGGYGTVKTITALFGQSISENFPIVGTNGVTYDDGERWNPQNSSTFKQVLVVIDTMPAENVTFRVDTANRPLKTMNYYLERLPGKDQVSDYDYPVLRDESIPDSVKLVSWNGKNFVLISQIKARYQMVTEAEDYLEILGAEKYGSDPAYVNGQALNSDNDETINMYYTRKVFPILYLDGAYYDGNGSLIADEEDRHELDRVDDIEYLSDVSSYNKGESNYDAHIPTYEGYVFEGWFIDKDCKNPYTFTTMPEGGITVYAKWRQIQYRVFLHPNVVDEDGNRDESLVWGAENEIDPETGKPKTQAMTFRIAYNGHVSSPTGLRDEFELVGWYLDEACTQVFNADNYVLNETNVTTPYTKVADPDNPDKPVDYTDPIDKWGLFEEGKEKFNSDATGYNGGDRFWITKKLDVYALWRAVIVGADGINIVYDAGENGTNPPTDNGAYLDQADAPAQAASTGNAGYKFDHWQVQKYVDGNWADSGVSVYPGETFRVYLKDALKESNGGTAEDPKFKYTIQLLAIYVEEEKETPTDITWYSNVQDRAGIKLEQSKFVTAVNSAYTDKGYFLKISEGADGALKINEPVDIPAYDLYSYPGYTFLGWAKLDKEGDPEAKITTLDQINADELFLKWVPGEGDAAGHYVAKNDAGNYVTVTKVAADEHNPHQMLVAVWQGEFYVYHSGVDGGNLETVKIKDKSYDLTQHLTENTLYGGYYLKNGFTAPEEVEGQIPAYDGTNWVWSSAENSEKGNAITPKGGATYYIKEVPAETYLQPYFHYTYKKGNSDGSTKDTLTSGFMITALDDKMYQETGFAVVGADGEARIVKSITINATSSSGTTYSVRLTPETVFRAKGLAASDTVRLAFLQVVNDKGVLENYAKLLSDGAKVVQYWKTMDGLYVTSQAVRTYHYSADGGKILRVGFEADDNSQLSQILSAIDAYADPASSGSGN